MFPGEGGFTKNPAVRAAGFFLGGLHAKSEGNPELFLPWHEPPSLSKPPVRTNGGSRRSDSPAEVLPQPGLPVDILDLRLLRSRAAVLHGCVSRPSALSAASRGQPALSAERRGATGSSRPAAGLSLPAVVAPRDGSRFSIGFISFTIGGWKSDHDAGGCSVAYPAK